MGNIETTQKVKKTSDLSGIDYSALLKSLKSADSGKPRALAVYLIECGYDRLLVASWAHQGIPDRAVIEILRYYGKLAPPHHRKEKAAHSLEMLSRRVGEPVEQQIEEQPEEVSSNSIDPREIAIEQIKSEFTINADGQATVTIRGAARLAGVSPGGLCSSLASGKPPSPPAPGKTCVHPKVAPLAAFLWEQGFKGVHLWLAHGVPDTGLALILEYYGYECQPRYRTEQAKQCCRAFAAIGIRSWIQSELNWAKPEPKPKPVKHLPPTPDEIASIFDLTLGKTSLPESLVAGVKLNAIEKAHPRLREACEEGRRTLAAHSAIPELLLTPTAVGERLGISAQAVNRLLVDFGYQVENRFAAQRGHRSEAAYVPTEKGRDFCSLTLATAKNNTSYQHLKWRQSIVPKLQPTTLWWQVLENIEHRATRELFRQQGQLIEIFEDVARVGMSSGLVRVAISKLAVVESAFAIALNRPIVVQIEATR